MYIKSKLPIPTPTQPQIVMKTYSMSSSMKNGELQHIQERGLSINSDTNMYSYMTNKDGNIIRKEGKLSDIVKSSKLTPDLLLNVEKIEDTIQKKTKRKTKTKTKGKPKKKTKTIKRKNKNKNKSSKSKK